MPDSVLRVRRAHWRNDAHASWIAKKRSDEMARAGGGSPKGKGSKSLKQTLLQSGSGPRQAGLEAGDTWKALETGRQEEEARKAGTTAAADGGRSPAASPPLPFKRPADADADQDAAGRCTSPSDDELDPDAQSLTGEARGRVGEPTRSLDSDS